MLQYEHHHHHTTVPIADTSTVPEVQQWLHTNGFGSSAATLADLDGSQLFSLSKGALLAMTSQGAAIYAALYGVAM